MIRCWTAFDKLRLLGCKRSHLAWISSTNINANCEMSVQSSIERKLMDGLKPSHLEVINESYMHNVPKGSESHFKVVVVSDMFETMSLIKRHRAVNDILKEELAGTIHALSIQAKTVEQWETSGHSISSSPRCLGGGRK